jgi:hypothetical protein
MLVAGQDRTSGQSGNGRIVQNDKVWGRPLLRGAGGMLDLIILPVASEKAERKMPDWRIGSALDDPAGNGFA